MALSDKQRCFVAEYQKDLNATQAAIRAGYSEKTARVSGAENLSKPAVALAISEALAARSERTAVDADMVIAGLVFEAKREGEGSSHGARVSAWQALGKHLGMFIERGEIKHTISHEDALSMME